MIKDLKVLQGRVCPYCSKPSVFVDSKEIYRGTSYGMIYLCRPCRAYVGVHKGTNKALGRLANEDLREWKKKAHEAFDPLWKNRIIKNRHQAYKWLAKQLGIPTHLTHIGMFDIPECRRVVELSAERLKKETDKCN